MRRFCVPILVLLACRSAMADGVSAAGPATLPATRPAAVPPVDVVVGQMVIKANQVLTEPLGAGATPAQASTVLADRADRVQRLAEPLVGQRVIVNTPVSDVVETAKDKSLPKEYRLAAKGQFVVAQAPQVDADWKKRLRDAAAEGDKYIKAFPSQPKLWEERKRTAMKAAQADQQLNLPRATVIAYGDDARLATLGGGAAMRVEGVIRKVEFSPWSPVSAGTPYRNWSQAGKLLVFVEIAPGK